MVKIINTLIGILFTVSLAICIIFKDVFVWLLACVLLSSICISCSANIRNMNKEKQILGNEDFSANQQSFWMQYLLIDIYCIIWFLLCEVFVFCFKYFANINVFEEFRDGIVNFVFIGSFIVLSLVNMLQKKLSSYVSRF